MFAPILVLMLIIFAVIIYFWLTYEDNSEIHDYNKIHRSGQYSIIRTSPRDDINNERISKEKLIEQVKKLNLPDSTIDEYYEVLEKNIKTIELADDEGVDFFLFDKKSSNKKLHNMYVKRKDIIRNSNLIPPYHIKDRSILLAEKNIEKIEDYIKVPSNIETSISDK